MQWFVNGKGYNPDRICESTDKECDKRSFQLSSYDTVTPHFKPGENVRCQIRARYNTYSQNNWTQPVSSALFFAGIEIRPRQLDIEECDIQNTKEYTFQLRPTIPIRFNTVPTKDTITLSFGARDDDSGDYLPSECKISLSHSDVNKWKNVSVQVICDNIDKPAKKAAFTFSVADMHVFWAHYTLPSVVLTKIETPVNLCQATGDPHYTTFDGKYYDFYKPGDYVLYRNLERFFEIHTRLWTCWSVTCNCGVAIR